MTRSERSWNEAKDLHHSDRLKMARPQKKVKVSAPLSASASKPKAVAPKKGSKQKMPALESSGEESSDPQDNDEESEDEESEEEEELVESDGSMEEED